MMLIKVVALLVLAAYEIEAICMHPPTAANYTNAKYSGLWYEIGKIQTPGGASYQENCICTTTTVSSDFPIVGDASVLYNCREYTFDGNSTLLTGKLTANVNVPGNFKQSFNPLLPSADYNVIWLDDDTAMEYDCVSNILAEEYCIHFMSRKTTIDPAKFDEMMNYALGLGLNVQGISYEAVVQQGCW